MRTGSGNRNADDLGALTAPGSVDLWRLDARPSSDDPAAGDLADSRALLSADEQARAAAFRIDDVRRRFIRHRGGMRRILAAYCGIAPADVAIAESPLGKPHLLEWPHAISSFNLSHSGDLAVLAVTSCGEIGVDIEPMSAGECYHRLAPRVLSPQERALFALLSPSACGPAFIRCWTRKEACLKASGRGLSTPPNKVCVGFVESAEPVRSVSGEKAHWWIAEIEPWPGIIGAVAVARPALTLRWFNLVDDLPIGFVASV